MDQKIRVGDRIYIEQAWEDETGNFHDEYADVKAIDVEGRMTLEFDDLAITEFLANAEFFTKDYNAELRD